MAQLKYKNIPFTVRPVSHQSVDLSKISLIPAKADSIHKQVHNLGVHYPQGEPLPKHQSFFTQGETDSPPCTMNTPKNPKRYLLQRIRILEHGRSFQMSRQKQDKIHEQEKQSAAPDQIKNHIYILTNSRINQKKRGAVPGSNVRVIVPPPVSFKGDRREQAQEQNAEQRDQDFRRRE